jgi:hypothetical protein
MIGRSLTACIAIAPISLLPALAGEPVTGSGPSGKPQAAPAGLAVYPGEVRLETKRDRQSVVVQATYPDGLTRDVTAEAKLSLDGALVAKLEKNVLLPAADGSARLKVEFGGRTAELPVEVKDSAAERPISFRLDVMPVFMKAGCNSGSCHGAAKGKDGFRLSLFGFDPEGDYFRLTREMTGRRLNLALPCESLMLEKPTGAVPHTGGTRFTPESELYRTLLSWLEAGAPNDPPEVAKLVGIEVLPRGAVLDGPGATQQLVVRAKYSDGTDRDVTSLTFFLSNNDVSAKVSPTGLVTAGARGEAFILARYAVFTVGVQTIVLPKGLEFTFPEVAEQNYIDKLVHQKLRKLRIAPSEPATDDVFLRRATLDIVGLLPTAEEYRRFLSRTEPQKRELLVDELLGRKEFIELWVGKWAELLQIKTSNQVSYKAMLLYFNWLQDKLQKNVPMDVMVQELLSARGGTFENAATNYYQNETDTLKVSENVAQVFMGMRIQCAQCHNHPFDRWTQDDYYGFAAFFSQIGRKGAEDPRETIIFNSGGGEVAHPVGGRVMKPKFLGGETPDLAGKDRREVMARWLASPQNPYFATNLANIVWAHFFGRGIIQEVDDVRVSNPPVNPELLEELGKKFTEYRYDFKSLVRDICTSRTYGLSTQSNPTNESDERNFSKGTIRRIKAEALLDCISQMTETKNKFQGLPLGARAVQIADGSSSNYFLTTFGRATRATPCSCEVKMDPNLSQALHLLNGDTVTERIKSGGLIERKLKEKVPPAEIIEDLYLRSLSRKPTGEEKEKFQALLAAAVPSPPGPPEGDQKKVLEDIFWALLNSREFLFNH